jgi:aminoglycoside 3-N-acetyltransferase
MITQRRLIADLLALGLTPGQTVVVHSALRSIGYVEGGAQTVVQAFQAVVGPAGLLVFPTFTYSGSDRFEPAATSGKTGAIAEAARHWPGAIRSWHPTHSVVAIGQEAAAICAEHHLVGGLAKGSPLDRAAQRGGMIVLLGVGHTSNSTIHVGESHAAVRYRAVPFSPDDPPFARIVSAAGSIDTPLHEPPGCSKAFGVIEYPLRRRSLVHDGKVGAALAQRIPGLAVIATVKALLAENPAALLCTDPQCYRCTTARTMVRTEGGHQ